MYFPLHTANTSTHSFPLRRRREPCRETTSTPTLILVRQLCSTTAFTSVILVTTSLIGQDWSAYEICTPFKQFQVTDRLSLVHPATAFSTLCQEVSGSPQYGWFDLRDCLEGELAFKYRRNHGFFQWVIFFCRIWGISIPPNCSKKYTALNVLNLACFLPQMLDGWVTLDETHGYSPPSFNFLHGVV